MTIKDKIKAAKDEAETLRILLDTFPDLHEHQCRWETVLVSKQVNTAPTAVEYLHSCGCCDDALLYAWFYTTCHGRKVYSDPPNVHIGSRNSAYGEEDAGEYVLVPHRRGRVEEMIGKAAWALVQDGPHGGVD